MIKKMRRRYLILIMALLSGTLLLCLAILFGFLYHTEVSSSYTVMQEMIKGPGFPGKPPEDDAHAPERAPADRPEAAPQNEDGNAVIEPLMYQGEGLIAQPLNETEEHEDWQGGWNPYDPFNPYNPLFNSAAKLHKKTCNWVASSCKYSKIPKKEDGVVPI